MQDPFTSTGKNLTTKKGLQVVPEQGTMLPQQQQQQQDREPSRYNASLHSCRLASALVVHFNLVFH